MKQTPEELKAARRAEIVLAILAAVCIGIVAWFGMGCATIGSIIDLIPGKPTEQPQEPSQPQPEPEPPEPVNKGGHGLYKPESSLWLLPRGIRAATIETAGEYRPDGSRVKWFRLGGNSEPRADGNQPIRDVPGMYHPQHQDLGGVKLRDARATASGNIFRAQLRDGRSLEKTIIDRNVRQE